MASPKIKQVKLGKVVFGDPHHFVLIGGPCVIENESMALRHAERISKVAKKFQIPYVFKSSYDKANRSSVDSYRGPGIEKGLKILKKVKNTLDIPVLSDVHSISQVVLAREVLDVIQIPAFLCRQTDLIMAAADTGKVVNIKKGQFLAPWDMTQTIQKVESTGNQKILLTERGTCFGYNNLVSDFRSLSIMRQTGYPVVFDATHSVQQPGGLGTASGGQSEYIPLLARCALAAGCDAIFIEVHPRPLKALSDGPNMLPLNKLEQLLVDLQAIDCIAKHR